MLTDEIRILPWHWFIDQAKATMCLRFGTRAQKGNRGVKKRTHKGKPEGRKMEDPSF